MAEPKEPVAHPVPEDAAAKPFVVVGIGASAGGLAALEEFFEALPADGSARHLSFVVVQHLDPDHESMLLELVKRYTDLKAVWVEDGVRLEAGSVYIMPRNSEVELHGDILHLCAPGSPRGMRLPIDHFFESLASNFHERAVGIVVSGTGSDGTVGARTIKAEGGIVIAQLPESAGYDGMPRSVISAGVADFVLAPRDMPEQLVSYFQHALNAGETPLAGPEAQEALGGIIVALRDHTGHDFTHYKPNTIRRRVERRMALTRVDRMSDYLELLRRDPVETETLFRELLIGVTSFFRDKAAFDALRVGVIEPLVASKESGETIRVWVPGCSTGEEPYSIAVLLQEAIAETKRRISVQVFATDIDLVAIEKARAGIYPDTIAVDISAERLERYFVATGTGFRVSDGVRETLVFAKQDVTRDPPFSRVDLISCRNLLIYLDAELQKRLLPLFHYALHPGGYLFLGTSETVGEAHALFATTDKRWKIYQRDGGFVGPAARTPSAMPSSDTGDARKKVPTGTATSQRERLREIAEAALLERHAPAAVVVNPEADILFIHGHTGAYLEPASGEATNNLLKMARDGVRFELASGLRKALAARTPVRFDGLRIRSGDETTATVNLLIEPLGKPADPARLLLVVFEEVATPAEAEGAAPHVVENAEQRIADLDRELSAKEEFLKATVEELETSNEELKSTNEELQSSNEELQSTIEELETSKEELQSVNEELVTVNSELQQKIEQLSQANNDMNNLLAGTGIGTLFVDHSLRIQRFTPAITDIINLIPSDVGRPLGDIAVRLEGHPDIVGLVQGVLATLASTQLEVSVADGRAFSMRIQPYRTLDNVIEGAVISFVDETQQRSLRQELERLARVAEDARDYAENVVDAIAEPLLVLDDSLTVVSANAAFYRAFAVTAEGTVGRPLSGIGSGLWAQAAVSDFLHAVLSEHAEGKDLTFPFDSSNASRSVTLSVREFVRRDDGRKLIIVAVREAAEA